MSETQLLTRLGVDSGHAVLIDLKPTTKGNVSLYRITDVWGFSYLEWTPICLRLESLFIDEEKKDAEVFKKEFEHRAEDGGVVIHEFLYLNGGVGEGTWNWGMTGAVNSALLFRDAWEYLAGQVRYDRDSRQAEEQDVGGASIEREEMEEGMGFKKLTPANWLRRDPVMRVFVQGAMSGKPYVPSGEERVGEIMSIELSAGVPFEVRRLFTAVRGALCYGYFFYPLYALASEQLSRVAETAVARKYEAIGGPRRVKKTEGSKPKKATFEDKLGYLHGEGLITEPDAVWWGAIRELRNAASHPQDHRPQDPGAARRRAEAVAEQVNALFRV